MKFRWKRAERPAMPAGAGRREPGLSVEPRPVPAGCGWFDSSDELRRGLEVLEADAGTVGPAVTPREPAGAG